MFKIINKDLRFMFASKMQKITMLIIVPMFLLIIEAQRTDWLYFTILVSVAYILIMTPFSLDITSKSVGLINSLPISRKEMVIYKYLSVFAYLLISIVYSGIYLWLINKAGFIDVDYFNLSMIGNAVFYIMVITSIMFPANFKFEEKVARVVNVFLYSGSIVLAFNLAQKSVETATGIMEGLLRAPVFISFIVIIYILSMVLSIYLYENRDL